MMAGQNITKKYLMCQIPIKMSKQHAIPNSILHKYHICTCDNVFNFWQPHQHIHLKENKQVLIIKK